MIIPPDRAPTYLNPLPNRIIHGAVRHNDIPSLRKGWNDTRYCREGLRVDYTGWRANMGSDVGFCLDMHVLGSVEAWGPAGAHAVGAEGLDGFLFEGFVGNEVVEVIGGEICDGAAVGELASGARWAADRTLSVELRNPFETVV